MKKMFARLVLALTLLVPGAAYTALPVAAQTAAAPQAPTTFDPNSVAIVFSMSPSEFTKVAASLKSYGLDTKGQTVGTMNQGGVVWTFSYANNVLSMTLVQPSESGARAMIMARTVSIVNAALGR